MARGRIMGAAIATTVYAVSRGCFNELQTTSRTTRREAGVFRERLRLRDRLCREDRSERLSSFTFSPMLINFINIEKLFNLLQVVLQVDRKEFIAFPVLCLDDFLKLAR